MSGNARVVEYPRPSVVRQKHPNGCQIAVLAMVLGVTYEEALARVIPDGGDPEGSTWLETWLADAGWAVAKKYRWINPGKKERPKWPLDPWADLHYVNVQYSSASGQSHAVLMLADGSVLDPGHDEPRRLSDYFAVNSMSALAPVRSLESVSNVARPSPAPCDHDWVVPRMPGSHIYCSKCRGDGGANDE